MSGVDDIPLHPYAEIGALLCHAREKTKRLTQSQVSHELHIRMHYIEAMESGHFEALPGMPYAKGYLIAYANFLELDTPEIIRRFEQLEHTIARRELYFPQVFSKEKAPHPNVKWGAVALALVVIFAWQLAMKPARSPISIVENFPGKPINTPNSADKLYNINCFHPADRIYPPCYRAPAGKPKFNFLPDMRPAPMGNSLVTKE